jgi:hypothetical protein
MNASKLLPLALSLLILGGLSGAVWSFDGSRLDRTAADAFAAADYKKAESQWHKLLDRLNMEISRNGESKSLSQLSESTLRHLGECALGQKSYDTADHYFHQAKATAERLQIPDADLEKDLKDLAVNYRLIDLNNLGNLGIMGPIVTAALSDFHPSKVSVARTDNGHHVAVLLADDVIKDIGSKAVTQVGVSKNISFDLIQGEGGAITLANITGIRVHAGFWVNIINSSLKLDESQRPMALVTAQKMGISQSVSTSIPDMIYLPVVAIVSQVKGLFGDSAGGQATAATPANSSPPGIAPFANLTASPSGSQSDAGANSATANSATATVNGTVIAPTAGGADGANNGTPASSLSPIQNGVMPDTGAGVAPVTNNTGDNTAPLTPIAPATPSNPSNPSNPLQVQAN